MGADIRLGKPGAALGHFRDDYGNGLTTLNYLEMSYWQDLRPRLTPEGELPLQQNEWLLSELRQRMAERLQGPTAVATAADCLAEHNLRGVPALLVGEWYAHTQELIRLIEHSTRIGVPLTMSL
jgi:hypothetical protein